MDHLLQEELPLGFSMALAENLDALDAFSRLSNEEKKKIVADCGSVRSKQEMRAYVDSLRTRY